jgi:hypothetical protein
MTTLTDIIKYFAKFPDKAGVLKNFARTVEKVDGYDEIKAYVNALGDPLLPDIKGFVFGHDDTIVTERIRNMKDYFMFIEYGMIKAAQPDKIMVRYTDIALALTIAIPFNDSGRDPVEQIIISDNCLTMVQSVLDTINADDSAICPIHRYLESRLDITPIIPELFYGNIGWVVTFNSQLTPFI